MHEPAQQSNKPNPHKRVSLPREYKMGLAEKVSKMFQLYTCYDINLPNLN
jgi:hypothetical protein